MEKPAQECRAVARHRALKEARIAFRRHGAVIDCVIRNQSDRGACLSVESPIGFPIHSTSCVTTHHPSAIVA